MKRQGFEMWGHSDCKAVAKHLFDAKPRPRFWGVYAALRGDVRAGWIFSRRLWCLLFVGMHAFVALDLVFYGLGSRQLSRRPPFSVFRVDIYPEIRGFSAEEQRLYLQRP